MLLMIASVAVSLTTLVSYADAYHTVRVEYRFIDDSVAHDPYVAVLAEGSDVDITVTNPALPGYKPQRGKEYPKEDPPELTTRLEYENLRTNHVITIYYVPDEVRYRVHYYKQNVNDDLYSEDLSLPTEICERKGFTGTSPGDLELPFDGFTALFHDPGVIAADGSTQFKVYYDRNYYLINFDLNGGYGVEPVYAKFDSIYNIAEPSRKGWEFRGWVLADNNGNYIDEDGNILTNEQAASAARKFSSGRVPSKNVNYKAYWTESETHYTIVYWVQDANGSGYTDVAAQDVYKYKDDTEVKTGDTLLLTDTNTVPDFFSYNLNPQKIKRDNKGKIILDEDLRPIYMTNDQGQPIDEKGNVIDFPEMSPGEREELNGKGRYFEINTEKSDQSVTVSGDGTTCFNVYYNRKEITQRFFFARKTSNGKYQIPGLTKAFSSADGTLDEHLTEYCGARTDWMELSNHIPEFSDDYKNKLQVKEYSANNCTYYYYELKTRYYANMRDNWLEDAFKPLLITKNKEQGVEGDDYARFGAWSVEWGTPYATKANKTVKGIYEKLDEQILYTDEYLNKDYGAEATVLNYLSFWANAKNKDWNKKNTYYNFTYKNYVEILPTEYNSDRTEWNGKGGYEEVVKVTYNVENDPTNPSKIKIYGLLPDNIIETYDGGTQYDKESGPGKRYPNRDAAVRDNQTATSLTGFELLTEEEVAKTDDLPYNTVCNWYAKNGFDTDHHADVKFFYRRLYYSLVFLNNDVKESEKTRNIYYKSDINTVDIRNNWMYFEPEYPDDDLRNYYNFDGWYFDQDCRNKIETIDNDPAYGGRKHFNSTFTMPADDVTVYAKWNLVKENISFYHDYNALIDGDDPVHTCMVEYNNRILTKDVPTTVKTEGVPYLETPENSTFAGWYYLNESNTPVRFDPASMPVTQGLKLYARWSSTDTARYLITYVEKGTGVEVAAPTTGTAFVHQTKTFRAKTGSELNEAHRTGDGENIWRPMVSSHSICADKNESDQTYKPNVYVFQYIRKKNVWYRVRYIDALTKEELYQTKEAFVPEAIVTEASVTVSGYLADSATKTAVLAASDKADETEAKNEELEANTITFFYTPNTTDVLYTVNHYVQKIDGSGYELNKEETNSAKRGSTLVLSDVFGNSATAQSLIGNGFAFKSEKTTVNGQPAQAEYVLDDNPLTISFFYDRNKYAYKVLCVDYDTDETLKTTIYNTADQLQPVGKTITVVPDQHIEYVPSEGADPVSYTCVSTHELTTTIFPDNNENPAINVIKAYYRKNEKRLLRYMVSCDHETEDKYADVSDSQQIVANQSQIRTVTAIPYTLDDHEYTFLGWYAVPHPGEGDQRLTADLGFTASFPGADMTYYAVFHQEQVSMNVEIMYNDTGVYDDTAIADTDGSRTGHKVTFDNPRDYVTGSETPLNKIDEFKAKLTPKDDKAYLYEFAGWYCEKDGSFIKDDDNTTKQLNISMSKSWHYIAMFKKVSEIQCRMTYRFTPRVENSDTDKEDGRNEFVVKKTLAASEFEGAVEYDDNGLKLKKEYVMSLAPYESNHFENLYWDDKSITFGSSGGALCATVTADQQKQVATVNYRLSPDDAFTAFQTALGSNRNTDPQLAQLDVRGKTYGGKYFSYWEIKNDKSEIVAKCYEPWFSFRVWEDYRITPVFSSDSEDAPNPPADPVITLTKLDDSRNRWTDSEGNPRNQFRSDYLYTDFEVAYEGPDIYNDQSCSAGIVFEVCGKYSDGLNLSQCDYATDENNLSQCDYATDENNLKTAIKNNNSTYVYAQVDGKGKKRTIQINPISTSELSTRSRAQYGKVFRNVINAETKLPTNGNYIFKVYAYLIKGGEVTLSNPVYVCLHDVAVRDLMNETSDSP